MYILIFILGIIIGSFLNVCIYRIPKGESIAFPSSHCTYCSTPLKWYDLVPIFSFLSLRGKCRYCGGAISPQYPIVELLNGFLYLLNFYYFGLSIDFVFYSFLISILIVISFIDYYEQIIPDGLVLMILISAIIYRLSIYFIDNTPLAFWNSIIGFLTGGVLFLLIAVVSKGAMGGGDIKLIAVLGFILGLKKTLLHILLSFLIGAVFSIILLLSGKKGRKDAIPFGPFICLAFLITILYGDGIINWYILRFLM
jgi:leader peptidase (prepilin peptidase)/N-methyltransferase